MAYYVRTSVAERHAVCEGPFESIESAWLHEYANDLLDASRSDSRRGLIVRQDGRHSFICNEADLQMDLDNQHLCELGYVYEIRPVSAVVFPEFWPSEVMCEK
jgi:hypothetical protein